MAVTWNPSDKGTDCTLSGGDLTASFTVSSHDMARATISKSTGKWYWEVTCADAGTNFGVANATETMDPGGGATTLGQTANSAGTTGPVTGDFVFNNTIIFAAGAHGAGVVWGFALDMGARTLAVYRNNSLEGTATSAQLPSGNLFAAIGGGGGGSGMSATAKFAAPFTFTPPATFDPYDPNSSLTHAMTGGVGAGSNFVFYPPPAHQVTGGVGVGSNFTIFSHVAFVHAMTGGVGVGGDSTIAYSQATIYDLADDNVPQGGMLHGGAALIGEVIPYLPAGGLKHAGSPEVLERIPFLPTGGILHAGSAPLVNVFVVVPTGGLAHAGAAAMKVVFVEVGAGGRVFGGAAAISDYQAWFAPSGGFEHGGTALAYMLPSGVVLTAENPYNDDFPGWALNLETNAPSAYLRLPANSFCQMDDGVTYVANAAGIYALDAKDDQGQKIKAAVMIAQSDYGSAQEKQVPHVVVAARSDKRMRLGVSTHTGSKHYYSVPPSAKLRANRVKLGLGLEGRYWSWILENTEGGDLEFESIAFTPAILKRLGK